MIWNTSLVVGILFAAEMGYFLFQGELLTAVFLSVPQIIVMGGTLLADPQSVCGREAVGRSVGGLIVRACLDQSPDRRRARSSVPQ